MSISAKSPVSLYEMTVHPPLPIWNAIPLDHSWINHRPVLLQYVLVCSVKVDKSSGRVSGKLQVVDLFVKRTILAFSAEYEYNLGTTVFEGSLSVLMR